MKRIFHTLLCALAIGAPALIAQNEEGHATKRGAVDCEATTLEEFFDCYGGDNVFSPHLVTALTAFIKGEDALKAGDYIEAQRLVNEVWAVYPIGENIWWNATSTVFGTNVGSPYAYYGLRMIDEVSAYHLNKVEDVVPEKAVMKVLVAGCSEGIQPSTEQELISGGGSMVRNELDPKIAAEDYRIVRQSLSFFTAYVNAITAGRLEIELEFVLLPDVCVPTKVTTTKPYVAYDNFEPMWDAISEEEKERTDWWWLLYPSHVPEGPDFDDEAFITGGMGLDYKGGPAFIVDDRWLVRKHPHLGDGSYSDIERRVYLPQWFQHKFFHHLYRAYPELMLEVNGHDWFDRSFWPADFEGQFESDYYAETLHKRLQNACTPLHTKLLTARDESEKALFADLVMEDFLGEYALEVVQNEWHEAQILQDGDRYYWKNKANVQWEIIPDLANGILQTGSDAVYQGEDYFIDLHMNRAGEEISGFTGLRFQGEIYRKQFNLFRESLPLEIVLSQYQQFPPKGTTNSGNIEKEKGKFFWHSDAGDRWSLLPDIAAEVLALEGDVGATDSTFALIFIDDVCGSSLLGFEFDNTLFLQPKKNMDNQAPLLENPIEGLEVLAGFEPITIDLSAVFSDPEGDELLFFAQSEDNELLSLALIDEQLTIQSSGSKKGSTTATVIAVDANGGAAYSAFTVRIEEVVSSVSLTDKGVDIFPNPTVGPFQIRSRGESIEKVRLHDLAGRLISSQVEGVDAYTLSIAPIESYSGMLLVEITLSNGAVMNQLIVKQ